MNPTTRCWGYLNEVDTPFEVIGKNHVVVPDGFFKSVLAEERKSGRLRMWSFAIPNEKTDKNPSEFLVPTEEVERRAGLSLWDRLRGNKSDNLRKNKGRMWARP